MIKISIKRNSQSLKNIKRHKQGQMKKAKKLDPNETNVFPFSFY
jgi:hypothetical protein